MKSNFYIIFLILVLITVNLFFAGCQTQKEAINEDKINVIVSILPQVTFVEKVGGNLVNVRELIPPGGSPATYEPKPGDLIAIESADIYFRIGHIQFEKSHINKFNNLNPSLKIIDTSQTTNLRYFSDSEEHSHDDENEDAHNLNEEFHDDDDRDIDPHVWLSPIEVKKQIDIIAQTLSDYDPKNSQIYIKNANNFKAELDNLNLELDSKLNQLKTNKLMVFHPAWGYLARDYGLEQIAIEESGKEPTTEQLIALINKAKEEDINVIFVQSQFNKNIAESIASEIDAVVVSIDPLAKDYVNNLFSIAQTIEENLNN
jgi:zinc transport system substrate-binding protein